MYTEPVAQFDNLVNQHTIRSTLHLLAIVAKEKANQCLQSAAKWNCLENCPTLCAEDKQDGKQWVKLGRDLIALARKFNQLQ